MTKVYDNATDLITFARLQAQNTTSGSSYLGSDGLLKFAAEDEPRIEYGSDGSLKGLLIEEQRTNLLAHSEDFAQSYWMKQAGGTGSTPVVAASSLTDPAGGTGAYQVVFDAGAGTSSVDRSQLVANSTTTTTGVDYTHSFWVRGDVGGEQVVVRGAGNGNFLLFTLTTEWTRISATETAISTFANLQIGIRQSVNGVINSTATIHIYGAQLEAGSFATSYIPTTGSQSTRSPDIASIPVSAFGYNQAAGTVVVDVETFDADYNNWVWLLDGTSDTSLYGHTSSGWRVFGAGGTVAYLGSLPGDEAAVIGYAYDASASRCVLGGGVVAGVTNSQPVAVHTLRIGSTGNSAHLNGHIKSLSYFPRRLTDAQLQELTS